MSVRLDRLAVGFGLGLLGACFVGEFVQGYPCASDADCGPSLACIEGLCGGPGEAAVCGNGLVEVGEDCDDGNIVNGDGCSENCDWCGDGIAQAWEDCDDGNTADGDACTPDCRYPRCGDGYVGPGEECDDGNQSGIDGCTPTCKLPACGDGFVNVASEVCDDGNAIETDACTTACALSPENPVLELSLAQVKQFQFSWDPPRGATYYQLFERANPGEDFVQIDGDLVETTVALSVPLHLRASASYMLRACNALRCADSAVVDVAGSLAEAVGYFKASNTDAGDRFGNVAISDDGTILAVGASGEDSAATGVDGDQHNDGGSLDEFGAVYLFVRDEQGWSQQAYLKPSQNWPGGFFGSNLALAGDGNTLVASGGPLVYVFVRDPMTHAWSEQAVVPVIASSLAISQEGDTLAIGDATVGFNVGAVHLFVREDQNWTEQGLLLADNSATNDQFGRAVALSSDGNTLAVGAPYHAEMGAVYMFVRDTDAWTQYAQLDASNPGQWDEFGGSVALSGDAETLVVGAIGEDSGASGVDGSQGDDFPPNTSPYEKTLGPGAAYVFVREDQNWSQQAYLKASNSGANDCFGDSVAVSDDGDILAVAAPLEDSLATGVGGEQNDQLPDAGAVYVFVRSTDGWTGPIFVKPPYPTISGWFGGNLSARGSRVALTADGSSLAVGSTGERSAATGVGGNQLDDGLANAGAVYLY